MRASRSACALLLAAVVAGGVSSTTFGADEPKPAAAGAAAAAADEAKPKAQKPKAVRLTKPWKDMTSLSESQKLQIAELHRKAVEEIKQVEQREEAAILALLNAEQRAEVQALREKATAERKMKKPAPSEPAAATPAASEKAG